MIAPMILRERLVASLTLRGALAAAAIALAGCAAGTSEADPSGGTVASTGTEGGRGGAGGAGGTGGQGGLGGAGGGGGEGGGSGALEVCVLNAGGPTDACASPEELDYGAVSAGTEVMRLFRIDNEAAEDAVISAVTIASAAFSVETVRYEVDPGDPNSLLRIEQPLPATRAPGTALYFEVTYASSGAQGPLPASEVHVAAVITGQPTEDIVVPMVGSTSGCGPGTAACDADPTNGCETSTDTDPAHCGGCDSPCALSNATSGCAGGKCSVASCDLYFDDCDMVAANGCEASLLAGLDTCGSCNHSCKAQNATAFCNGGNCNLMGCALGFADCDLDAATGCEVDINLSLSHCGGCNLPCALANAAESCAMGTCLLGACDPGFKDCNGLVPDGCEIDLQTDAANCGLCNKQCVFNHAGSSCVAGGCVLGACDAGYGTCNGNSLDGCEADFNADVQHCGSCAGDCAAQYPHANVACNAGTCAFQGCAAGFYDLNASLADGCEYACTYAGAVDLPDDGFVDANCDGIDGEITKAIFVATTGSDAFPGTMAQPKLTVTAGLGAATAGGKAQVYVSEGIFNEKVTLVNGVSLYGGYSQNNGWKRSASFIATIRNGTINNGRVIAVEGSAITSPTTVDRLVIQTLATSTTSASSYAMHCTTCTALTLKNATLEAGTAGAGSAGTAGTNGQPGSGGQPGGPGVCDNNTSGGAGGPGGTSSCGRTGGAGGKGGDYGNNDGATGGTGAGGTAGGTKGSGGSTGGSGGTGSTGASGANGANGVGGAGGAVFFGFWAGTAGGVGANGAHGNGGGGGGGGGGQGCLICDDGPGNGGGGGGAGGCLGTGATGGSAGGGSFGLFLVSSTGFSVIASNISSASGGNGGAGGAAGIGGGAGGIGAGAQICTSEVGGGGHGGPGGAGGNGGHGGGGSGGPSWGIYRSNTSLVPVGTILAHGNGGLGGTSQGIAGSTGASGDML